MNKTKIAKELVKLAKELVVENGEEKTAALNQAHATKIADAFARFLIGDSGVALRQLRTYGPLELDFPLADDKSIEKGIYDARWNGLYDGFLRVIKREIGRGR